MHPPEYGSFNESLDRLQETFRALDRIRYTPLPFVYVSQLKVFMLIFFMSVQLAAAAVRSEGAVHSHTRRALAVGAQTDEIYHTLILLTSTIGFPNVLAALGRRKK